MAQFPPTKEQLANIKKIEELQKSNKKGKNKAEIIKLLNANQKVNKELLSQQPEDVIPVSEDKQREQYYHPCNLSIFQEFIAWFFPCYHLEK